MCGQRARLFHHLPWMPATLGSPLYAPRTPLLNIHITRSAGTNDSKSKMFYKTFFPLTNPHLLPPETNFQYPLPRWTFTNISNDQIQLAIARLKPYKASKHGSIPNSVLIKNSKILVPHLGPLFQ